MRPLKVKLKATEVELSVVQDALKQKMANSTDIQEENQRLWENHMDQKRIKQQRQMLKQGHTELQMAVQEMKEEKIKLKVYILHTCKYFMVYTLE